MDWSAVETALSERGCNSYDVLTVELWTVDQELAKTNDIRYKEKDFFER